jgi:hypothetical protein
MQAGSFVAMANTSAQLLLDLRNDGRTPAWIETITAAMNIDGRENKLEPLFLDDIEPLSAGAGRKLTLALQCTGRPDVENPQRLRVQVRVNYRDIFEGKAMEVEYSITPRTHSIERVDLRNPSVTRV